MEECLRITREILDSPIGQIIFGSPNGEIKVDGKRICVFKNPGVIHPLIIIKKIENGEIISKERWEEEFRTLLCNYKQSPFYNQGFSPIVENSIVFLEKKLEKAIKNTIPKNYPLWIQRSARLIENNNELLLQNATNYNGLKPPDKKSVKDFQSFAYKDMSSKDSFNFANLLCTYGIPIVKGEITIDFDNDPVVTTNAVINHFKKRNYAG